MTVSGTRRSFFAWTKNALAATGLAGATPGIAAAADAISPAKIVPMTGGHKIINTLPPHRRTHRADHSRSMPLSMQAAVAARRSIRLRLAELQQKAGLMHRALAPASVNARRLQMSVPGRRPRLPWERRQCMTVGNQAAVRPRYRSTCPGLKNEVLIQKAHRYGYDHAIKNCGIRFIEVETPEQYESAFTPRTAMCHYFNAAEGGQIGHEDWIRVARRHGVPCFNDTAADVPPISNLWKYTGMGFDLVTFSGGKGIRGPQNAGLLLGRKDLIEAATWSNSPRDETVGRGMKVAKEQVVGMVAAVTENPGPDR